MENALLYTLTTIAQSVAAAFGLLAAFVLFRLQSLDQGLWQDTSDLIGDYFNEDEKARLQTLRSQKQYGPFLEALATALVRWRQYMATQGVPEVQTPWSDGDTRIGNVRWSVEASRIIKRRLWQALWPTVVTVFCTTAAIPTAHLICQSAPLSWFSLAIALAMFLVCLGMYVSLIAAAIGITGSTATQTTPWSDGWMQSIKRLLENDDKSIGARIAYMWFPVVGSIAAVIGHAAWDFAHPCLHTLGRSGAIVTFFGGLSAYGGATRIWIRKGTLIRGVREVPYALAGAILALCGTLLWGYGDLLPW
jgi:hypothetical protein